MAIRFVMDLCDAVMARDLELWSEAEDWRISLRFLTLKLRDAVLMA